MVFERTLSDHGVPVRWAEGRIPLPVAPPELGPHAPQAVASAFAAWSAPPCASLRLDPAPTGSAPVRLRLIREGWAHAPQSAAYTTLDADPDTGAIRGALIELNAAFSFDPASPASADLQATLTHEAGHALGLAHSYQRAAVMSPGRRPGQLAARPLHPDDIAGVCAIYPASLAMAGSSIYNGSSIHQGVGPWAAATAIAVLVAWRLAPGRVSARCRCSGRGSGSEGRGRRRG